jgi:hypothetical protein
MNTYLTELIESVKRDINQEHKRVDHITFHTKKRSTDQRHFEAPGAAP